MPNFLSVDQRYMALEDDHADPHSCGCVVIPVAFEQTSSYGQGSDEGPKAILQASAQVELFDAALGGQPYEWCGGIATTSPLDTWDCDGKEIALRLCREVDKWIHKDKFVITLGGEHTSIVGSIQAHTKHYDDLTVLQFDAHSDLRQEYEGSAWSHACAMARVLDFHNNIVQVGIRSQCAEERLAQGNPGLSTFYAHDIPREEISFAGWVDTVVEQTKSNVYITFDCDVLDPSIMPATGTPEPDGMLWRQVDVLFRQLCKRRRLVGIDFCELAPIEALNHPQFTVAKLIYRLIGYKFAGL